MGEANMALGTILLRLLILVVVSWLWHIERPASYDAYGWLLSVIGVLVGVSKLKRFIDNSGS
jgi:hypothetical protein